MRTAIQTLPALTATAALLLMPLSGSGNSVPYAESFESYTNGHPISQVAGWSADASVFVSTNAAAVGALTNNSLFPLSGPHTKVLQIGGTATNALTSSTGGVAVLDFLVMPSRRRWAPSDDAMQLAAYASTNGRLTVWHQNSTNSPVNEWRELTNSPVLATDQWARVTVRMDQSNAMFQVSVNGGTPLVDDAGWTSNNGARPGSWFYMVQTNRAMADVALTGDIVSYLDDLTVAIRSLTLSTNEFREAAANDGTIDNLTPMTVALAWDTFAATNNENLAADPNKLGVGNLPSGLAVSALATSATQLTVTLTGTADIHEAPQTVSNLTFTFGSAAFASGRAWDVGGASTTNLVVRFQSSTTPVLSYDNTLFAERAANDGGVSGSAALSLTVKDFAGTNNEDFVASGRVTSTNLPAGLTASVVRTGARAATLTFAGQATAHAAADSLSNLNITFATNAFADGVAATVSNAVRSDLQMTFLAQPIVSYGGASFAESAANAGAVTNSLTLSLTGDNFTNAVFVQGTHFSATNVPAGLTLAVAYVSPAQVSVSLAGSASPHDGSANATVAFAFLNGAFETVAASNIVGSTNAFAVTFLDPPEVSASPAGFAEAAANNGTIGNTVTLSLTGTTFAAGPFSTGTHYTVTGVPAGLSFDLARDSATQLVASLASAAASHAAADSTNLVVTLLNGAFQTVAASNITGNTQTLGLTFTDPPQLNWSGTAFSEALANNGAIGNTLELTLAGASFTNGAFASGTHFTATGVPSGLTVTVTPSDTNQAVVQLTGQAVAHTSASNTSFGLAFTDAAFLTVPAANIGNSSNTLSVTFLDPPVLSYAPLTFTERGDDIGAMGNTVAISLSGANFVAGPLAENVAYTVTGVPSGLSFALTRNDDTSATASLGGQATSHSNANDTAISLTFHDAAFQTVGASNIVGTVTNLAVDFVDLPPANSVPFADGFETYPNGFAVVGTNGWTDGVDEAALVTNDPERVAAEVAPANGFPLIAEHAQILMVNTAVVNRTRSVAGRSVYLDFMAYVQGRTEAPAIGVDDQLGLYVDTNEHVTVWRRDIGAGTNLWTTLAGLNVTTEAWHRVTFYLDYSNALFKVRVDSHVLSDAAGWSGPGGTHPGPWFNLAQQNGYMSWVAFGGGKAGRPVHIDDVSISYDPPLGIGSVFKFR